MKSTMGFTCSSFTSGSATKKLRTVRQKVGVLNSLFEGADGDFAGKLLTASESSRLTIAQGLHRCVVVRCLTNVMFHAARENQGQVQRPNGRSTTEPNKPGLLPECLWPGSEIP